MNTNGSSPVAAGVVGVGNMGRHHARVYAELPGVDLVGVTDADAGVAKEVAEEFGTDPLDRDILFDRADAVSIAVPTAHHVPVARDALERDVDVLVEKPIAYDPDRGRELVDLAEAGGQVLQVGHVERFNPAVEALQDVLREVDPLAVSARRLGPPRDDDGGDGVALDLMVHDLDVLGSLFDGDPEVLGAASPSETDGGYVTTQVDYGGVLATLTASRVTRRKVRTLTVTGRERYVEVDYLDRSMRIHRRSLPEYVDQDGSMRYRHESVIERPTVENGEPLKRQLSSFVDAVQSGADPAVTGEDGIRAVEVARRIDRLARDRPFTEVKP